MARRPTVNVNLEAAREAAQQAASVVVPGAAGSLSVTIDGIPGQTVFDRDLDLLDTKSADYMAMENYWTKVANIVDGADAMRAAHDTYLPKFPAETDKDYEFRWKNSKFTNIYRDIVENLAAKPFEQEVTLVDPNETENKGKPAAEQVSGIPTEFETFVEDVDGSGNNITVFAADTFFNGINSAIDWIFVDYAAAPADGTVRTVAEEKALGLKPYWTHVLASNVYDARSRVINGTETLYYIRMMEYEPDARYIRILRSDGKIAAWELYREVAGKINAQRKFEFVNSGPITIGRIPMVPFVTGRRKARSFRFLPMMQDAAELQIELFQQECGLKNIETLAGFPMLSGEGVKPEYEGTGNNRRLKTLQTGPNAVLYGGTDSQGKPGKFIFISPDAAVLKFLLDHVKETELQLRELGRNPLTAQSGNLTVVTSSVAAKKGNSAVQMWAFGLKDALENALVLTGLWMGNTTYNPEVQVFTDFDVDGQGTDVAQLLAARKNGDISRPTLWHELQRRGMLSGEFNADDEEAKLLLETEAEEDLNTERMETEAEIAARNASLNPVS